MFNLDPGKLVLIAVVVVLVVGPDKLPDTARRIGTTLRSFNDFRQRMESEIRASLPEAPTASELVRMTGSPATLLRHLGDISAPATEPVGPSPEAGLEGAMRHGAEDDAMSPTPDCGRPQTVASIPTVVTGPVDAGLN